MSEVDLNELRKQREKSRREREEILKKKLNVEESVVIVSETFSEKQSIISPSHTNEKRERDLDNNNEQFNLDDRPRKISNLGQGFNQTRTETQIRREEQIIDKDHSLKEDFSQNQSFPMQDQRINDTFVHSNLPQRNMNQNAHFDSHGQNNNYTNNSNNNNNSLGNKSIFQRDMGGAGRGRGGEVFHRGGGVPQMTEYQKGRAMRSSEAREIRTKQNAEIVEKLKNDYSQHFVDSGERPQNFVRDSSMHDRFEEYPQLKDLLAKKDDLINLRNTQPFYMNADLQKVDLASLNTTFDVILMDPPLEEYYLRSLGSASEEKRKVGEKCPFWTVEELENLNIPAVAANPCFLFLWTGNGGEGLEIGRRLLKKWGFRRSEDIVWIKTNKDNPQAVPFREKGATFIRAKEHCLLGIRGSVRRNIDAHIIHSNIDTDVIIAEEPKQGSTRKPEELYSIIEHFCLGRRRLELFGEDHNIRPGWVTIGDKILSSNWDKDLYNSYFEPPNSFSNLVGTTPEIENLRPRSPSRDDSKILWYNPNKKVSNKGPPDRDIY